MPKTSTRKFGDGAFSIFRQLFLCILPYLLCIYNKLYSAGESFGKSNDTKMSYLLLL